MRYETYEEFRSAKVKKPITSQMLEMWGVQRHGALKNLYFEDILKNRIPCELIVICFGEDNDEVYYINNRVIKINVSNEQTWNWYAFAMLYKDLKYLLVRNAKAVFPAIFEMNQLKYLDFYYCDLVTFCFDEILKLKNLETLSLDDSTVYKIPPEIFELKNLKVLSLMHTFIAGIPEDLCKLQNLEYLGLNGTKLNEIPKVIGKLEGLTDLYLGQTEISQIPDELKNLKKLKNLALWETNLESLPDWICECKELRGLYLGRARNLTRLPEKIGDLTTLERLFLDETGLEFLPDSFCNLTNLKDLNLKGTKIRKLSLSKKMNFLGECDLSDMTLERIPRELIDTKMEIESERNFQEGGLFLENTKILCQPISLFFHEKEFIRAYYDEEKIHLNEAKIVFLGDGEAGKSHIIERIKKDDQLLEFFKEESTPGIAISQKSCNIAGEMIRLQIWDFGGQEIMHSMHRFFLTERTLYVIVINARDNTQDERAEYWLNNVKNFANGCPVIIVLNKMDQNPTASINERLLRNDYPQIVDIMKVSALKDDSLKFRNLMETVISTIKKFDSYAMDFPVSWNQIKIKLTDMDSNYIIDEQYREICRQYNVEDESIQNWLLDWFHDLGISFNYRKKGDILGAYMVLKPTWITNAIYVILFNGANYAQNGIISINNIVKLLKDPPKSVENIKYSAVEVPYILEVMRRFEISYSVDRDNEFIPMMCDKNQHEMAEEFVNSECLEYFMEYEYLPNNVLHKLMIQMQEKLMKDKIWLTGMILSAREGNIVSLVRMHEKRIEIFIRSLNNQLYPEKEFLSEIRDKLLNINKDLNLKAEDTIVYKENGMTENIKYDTLLVHLTSKQDEYFSVVFRKRIPIKQILNVVQTEFDTDVIMDYCKENEAVTVSTMNKVLMNVHSQNFYKELELDLVACCTSLQGNSLQILQGKENDRNTYLRELLRMTGKYIVCDQTLNGTSSKGKAAGELDLLIKDLKQKPVSIVEALTLNSVRKKYIEEHIDKLFRYDTWGLPNNYIIAYVENNNFQVFTKEFLKYVMDYEYPYTFVAGNKREGDYTEMQLFDVVLSRNGQNSVVTYILVHLQQKNSIDEI